MSNTGAPNPPRWSAEESFLELLMETLATMDAPSRGQFLQRFFRSIAQIELTETQSLDYWDQTLLRKSELSQTLGKRVSLQAALADVLAASGQLRMPILMEYEELRKLQINAATDALTGLYNRRFFDDYFDKELNRSSRYNHKLALVMLDLHRFKEVNDRFGHQQGDVALRLAAETFRKSLRTSDYAFRIGGDEFALLLPQSDTEQAATLSRRLRATYASSIEPMNLGIPLALDYGLAMYPDDGELQDALIKVADGRLYLLKNGTRSGPKAAAEEPNPISAAAVALPNLAYADPPEGGETKKTADRRRWQRFSMSDTNAYALVGENPQRKARVLDLGHGGLCLETSGAEEFGEAFHAVLHVPILPPVRVNLRRIYRLNLTQAEASMSRIGCSFVT